MRIENLIDGADPLGALIPLAHAGHWLGQIVYAAPLVFMGGLFAASFLRQRQARKHES